MVQKSLLIYFFLVQSCLGNVQVLDESFNYGPVCESYARWSVQETSDSKLSPAEDISCMTTEKFQLTDGTLEAKVFINNKDLEYRLSFLLYNADMEGYGPVIAKIEFSPQLDEERGEITKKVDVKGIDGHGYVMILGQAQRSSVIFLESLKFIADSKANENNGLVFDSGATVFPQEMVSDNELLGLNELNSDLERIPGGYEGKDISPITIPVPTLPVVTTTTLATTTDESTDTTDDSTGVTEPYTNGSTDGTSDPDSTDSGTDTEAPIGIITQTPAPASPTTTTPVPTTTPLVTDASTSPTEPIVPETTTSVVADTTTETIVETTAEPTEETTVSIQTTTTSFASDSFKTFSTTLFSISMFLVLAL